MRWVCRRTDAKIHSEWLLRSFRSREGLTDRVVPASSSGGWAGTHPRWGTAADGGQGDVPTRELGAERGFAVHAGLNASDDAFYAETPEWIATLSSYELLNVEMESSALFVVARQRGLRAGMVCAVSGNLITGDVVYGRPNERLHVGWEHSIDVALETVHRLRL